MAIEDLHSLRIAHRDIRAENIFISRDGRLVLCNFSRAICTGEMLLQSASEVLGAEDGMEPYVDVRAYGFVFLAILHSMDRVSPVYIPFSSWACTSSTADHVDPLRVIPGGVSTVTTVRAMYNLR